MNMQLWDAWVANNEYSVSSATVKIEGVGDLKITAELPPDIKNAVSAFYCSLAREKLKQQMLAGDQLRAVPTNPATRQALGDDGEEDICHIL